MQFLGLMIIRIVRTWCAHKINIAYAEPIFYKKKKKENESSNKNFNIPTSLFYLIFILYRKENWIKEDISLILIWKIRRATQRAKSLRGPPELLHKVILNRANQFY